jgi:hypothetical protein
MNNAILTAVAGKTEEEAKALIEQAGMVMRVVARDGQEFMVTMDYHTGRVNVVVNNGIVTPREIG